jgi:hypothetical protein
VVVEEDLAGGDATDVRYQYTPTRIASTTHLWDHSPCQDWKHYLRPIATAHLEVLAVR